MTTHRRANARIAVQYPLQEASILAAIDRLVDALPELSTARLARPWTISAIAAASRGSVAGHSHFPTIEKAARAVASVTFHVKPLNLGNTALAVLLAHILLTINGEEMSFAETTELVSPEFE